MRISTFPWAALLLALAACQAQSLSQIYYLGVYDPIEQVPAQIYRVTVHGSADAASHMRFASGWVPAAMIDSLDAKVSQNLGTGDIAYTASRNPSGIEAGRRLVMFGPEGFREAPEGHRLVIVMGASPEAFFKAIDEALGVVAAVKGESLHDELQQELLRAMLDLSQQQRQLARIETAVALADGKEDE